jgi:hypothetical protein
MRLVVLLMALMVSNVCVAEATGVPHGEARWESRREEARRKAEVRRLREEARRKAWCKRHRHHPSCRR